MSIKKILSALVSVIADEAEKNEIFKSNLERVLGGTDGPAGARAVPSNGGTARKGGRRTPAVLDPIDLARQGEKTLRAQISLLNLEQLRDIVAQYGMDPGKLVMKWKEPTRVIDRIVEMSLARATKGDAFRDD